MEPDEYDDWDLENRDRNATPQQSVTVYCRADGHDDEVRMRAGYSEVYRCSECGARVRIE